MVNVVDEAKTFAFAIKNPMTFIGAGNNWTTQDNSSSYMWQDKNVAAGSDGKSIFDPSPIGWKIPSRDVWSDFNRNAESPTVTWDNSTVIGSTYAAGSMSAYMPHLGLRNATTSSISYSVSNLRLFASAPTSTTRGGTLSVATSSLSRTAEQRSMGAAIRSVRE